MFERRSTQLEQIDDPQFDERFALESYGFMAMVNRYAGGARVVKRFIERMSIARPGGILRILDIGSGICDIPIVISRMAAARHISVQFTCIEPSGHAVRLARERIARAGITDVHVLQEDIFKHQPAEPYDCATASMCFHHFTDEQILAVIRRIRPHIRMSVLINDLRRSREAWLATNLLTLFAPAVVRNDALLSIRRGFKINELRSLLQQLDDCNVSTTPALFFRVAAVVTFGKGTNPGVAPVS